MSTHANSERLERRNASDPHTSSAADRFEEDTRPTRYTAFIPPVRGRMNPVIGQASDPEVARSLAMSGRGWVNRDGRVLTGGSCKDEDALQSLPETAEIVAAFEKAETEGPTLREQRYQELLANHVGNGGTERSFSFNHASYDLANPSPNLHKSLDESGWLMVELWRDNGAKILSFWTVPSDMEEYRETLVTLGTALDCRVIQSANEDHPRLLFDSSKTKQGGYVLPEEADPDSLGWDAELPMWTTPLSDEDQENEDIRQRYYR